MNRFADGGDKAESAEKALEPIEVDLLYAWFRPVCRIEHQPAFVKHSLSKGKGVGNVIEKTCGLPVVETALYGGDDRDAGDGLEFVSHYSHAVSKFGKSIRCSVNRVYEQPAKTQGVAHVVRAHLYDELDHRSQEFENAPIPIGDGPVFLEKIYVQVLTAKLSGAAGAQVHSVQHLVVEWLAAAFHLSQELAESMYDDLLLEQVDFGVKGRPVVIVHDVVVRMSDNPHGSVFNQDWILEQSMRRLDKNGWGCTI